MIDKSIKTDPNLKIYILFFFLINHFKSLEKKFPNFQILIESNNSQMKESSN
jgi:hypothetical protein